MEKVLEALQGLGEKVGGLSSELAEIRKKREEDAKKIATLEEKTRFRAGGTQPAPSVPGLEDEIRNGKEFYISRMLQGMITGAWEKYAPYEKDVLEQTRKTMTAGDEELGGVFLPKEVSDRIIELLEPEAIAFQLGAERLDNLTGELDIIREEGDLSFEWVGEGKQGTASDAKYGKITMRPHTAIGTSEVSLRLLSQSSPSIEQRLRRRFARALAKFIDKESMLSDGSENSPVGIIKTTGVTDLNLAKVPNLNDLKKFPHTLSKNDALRGNRLGWATSPEMWEALDKMQDANGRPLLGTNPQDRTQQTLLGYPLRMTSQIAVASNVTTLIFGAWDELLIGSWGALRIEISGQTGDTFKKLTALIRAYQDYDMAVEHPESFVFDDSIKTA